MAEGVGNLGEVEDFMKGMAGINFLPNPVTMDLVCLRWWFSTSSSNVWGSTQPNPAPTGASLMNALTG